MYNNITKFTLIPLQIPHKSHSQILTLLHAHLKRFLHYLALIFQLLTLLNQRFHVHLGVVVAKIVPNLLLGPALGLFYDY